MAFIGLGCREDNPAVASAVPTTNLAPLPAARPASGSTSKPEELVYPVAGLSARCNWAYGSNEGSLEVIIYNPSHSYPFEPVARFGKSKDSLSARRIISETTPIGESGKVWYYQHGGLEDLQSIRVIEVRIKGARMLLPSGKTVDHYLLRLEEGNGDSTLWEAVPSNEVGPH